MGRFMLTIETNNAAFHDGPRGDELARILRAVAATIEGTETADSGNVRDINGNKVGTWRLR